MQKLKDYLRVKEAAEFLGIAPNTLRNWSRDGKISFRRNPLNGYRLYRKSDLEELLQKISRPHADTAGPRGRRRG